MRPKALIIRSGGIYIFSILLIQQTLPQLHQTYVTWRTFFKCMVYKKNSGRMCKYYVIKYLHIYSAQCTLEYIYYCSTSQYTDSCLTLPRLFYAAGVFPSEKERKGEDPSVSHVISHIKHADRKSYLKRQEKEKVLCVNASRRKTGNSIQQIRRIVSSEKVV